MPPKRPKLMTKDTQIIIRMKEELKEKLHKAAYKAGVSLSEYIRTLAENSLKDS